MDTNTEHRASRLLTIGSILVGLAFLLAGSSKLAGLEQHVQSFEEFGLPIWLMYVVGATEVVAGGLLMLARTRFIAAIALAGTMLGAVGSHALVGHGSEVVPSAVLLIASLAIAYVTRQQLFDIVAYLKQRVRA